MWSKPNNVTVSSFISVGYFTMVFYLTIFCLIIIQVSRILKNVDTLIFKNEGN